MKRAATVTAWLLLATAALVLWPQRWGGSMTYVVTSGVSMQPRFTSGDLVLLRTAEEYGVGDVLAYRSDELGRVVMHRAVRETADGFVLRGDNNDFDDPAPVPEREVLGKLLLHVPRAGRLLAWSTRPWVLGVAAAGLLLLTSGERSSRDRPTRWTVQAVDLPEGSPTVELSAAELRRLARRHDVPLLQLPDGRACTVLSGALYAVPPGACPPPAARATAALPLGARPAPGACLPAGAHVPLPRRADELTRR